MGTQPPTGLTIGELALRTGVPRATLRSWENRHGFPAPTRRASGHRRYAEADVDAVLDVLRRRQDGVPLQAAVRAATPQRFPSRSVFVEVRRRHPQLAPRVLSKPTLVALSHAIEDECCARAARPVLFGGFQRARHLRAAHTRWAELARTARAAIAFGAHDRTTDHRPGALLQVPLPENAPLNREWVVVCDATDLPACLLAVERPGQEEAADPDRRFEMIWSVDPLVVRDAARVAGALADEYAPDWRPPDLLEPEQDPPKASPDLARAAALFDRMLAYVEEAR